MAPRKRKPTEGLTGEDYVRLPVNNDSRDLGQRDYNEPASPEKQDADPGDWRPTAEYVQGLWETRTAEAAEAHLRTVAANMRVLVKMDHAINIPAQYRKIAKEVRTPYLRKAWYHITGMLTHHRPVVHIEPRGETQDAKAASGIAERWVVAKNERQTKELGEDIFYESPKALVRDGESVIKIVHRPDAWANFPERDVDDKGVPKEDADAYLKRAREYQAGYGMPFPMARRVVDRLSMVFGDGEYGDEWALERGLYPRPYLGRRYGMVYDDTSKRLVNPALRLGGRPVPPGYPGGQLGDTTKDEYWDAEWWHVVIDGHDAPGYPMKNPYGCLPYFRAKAPDSETILYALMFLIPRMDELLTMKLNWGVLGAYPNPVLRRELGYEAPLGQDGQTSKLVWQPGKQIDLNPGEDLGWMVPPPVGADLDELHGIFREMVDIAGIPSILRQGASSGYEYNQVAASLQAEFKRIAAAAQRQYESADEFEFKMIDTVIKGPVFALATGEDAKQWLAVKPDGTVTQTEAPITMLGPVTYEVKPLLPTDWQAQAMIGSQLIESGLASKRWVREELLQIEDSPSMDEEIWVQTALEMPPLLDMVMNKALQESGMVPAAPNPTAMLTTPDGNPLVSQPGMNVPGQPPVAGQPSVPGQTMPLGNPTPRPTRAQARGRVGARGAYPGRPAQPRSRIPA